MGGTITAEVITRDPNSRVSIEAYPSRGRAGTIDSRGSFHIAGDVALLANRINVGLHVGGQIDEILAAAAPNGERRRLEGEIDAARVAEIRVVGGDAAFDLVTTAAAYELPAGSVAAENIEISGGNWEGGSVRTSSATGVGRFAVLEENSEGGEVVGQLTIDAALVGSLELGDIYSTVHVTGDVEQASIGRVFGSLIIDGQVSGELKVLEPLDVNLDTFITPIDVLLVINHLNRTPVPTEWSKYLDTSGDRIVTSRDVLLIINRINARAAGNVAAAEGERRGTVPSAAYSNIVLPGIASTAASTSPNLLVSPVASQRQPALRLDEPVLGESAPEHRLRRDDVRSAMFARSGDELWQVDLHAMLEELIGPA